MHWQPGEEWRAHLGPPQGATGRLLYLFRAAGLGGTEQIVFGSPQSVIHEDHLVAMDPSLVLPWGAELAIARALLPSGEWPMDRLASVLEREQGRVDKALDALISLTAGGAQ